jgi:glycosyltransferase involved in cell wall biosynthesis
MARVYIVLPTHQIGGAEKRFLGLFVGLGPTDARVHLVASEELLRLARGSAELAALETFGDRIVPFGRGPGQLQRAVLRALWQCPDAVLHDVLVPPVLVHPLRLRRVVFTVPLSGLNLYSRVGRASVYAGALAAGRTDFLDQGVHDAVARRLPLRRSRFSVTPGSFVDTTLYAPRPFAQRQARVQFVGQLSSEKQAFRLVDALPEIDRLLKGRGLSVAFRLAGRESGEQPSIAARLSSLPRTIDVQAGFDPEPRHALARSRVFLSLQRNTNYPSKALLEALACGALPVITDVADSRRMVPDGVAEWVPRDFGAAELATAIERLVRLSEAEHDERVARARAHLEQHFSFGPMAAYYQELWERAAHEG